MLGAMADLMPAYLLSGTDRPKVARAVRRLRDRIGEDATELLSASEADGTDVAAACNALGLFASERRLVVVENVEAWKAADLEPVLEYLKSPSPETVLALVGDGVRKDSPLAKAVAKAGEVLVYDLPKRGNKADLPGWVGRQPYPPWNAGANCCCFVGEELEKVPSVAQAKRIVPQIGATAKKVPRCAGCFHGLAAGKNQAADAREPGWLPGTGRIRTELFS